MAYQNDSVSKHSNAYNLFILLLTVFSFMLMVLLLLPLDRDTLILLQFYDILICLIFMVDFLINLKRASRKSDYFIRQRGWLDLLGSIPTLGVVFKYSGLLRLARLSQAERILRHRRGQSKEGLVKDVLVHRHRYVGYITILLIIIVLTTASALVLQFESRSPKASITTGWEAFWFSIVTITTTGYGDYSPVTFLGRLTAMFVMISGTGIIAVLASLFSRLLIGSPYGSELEEAPDSATTRIAEHKFVITKDEMVALRKLLEKISIEDDT